jgi:prepilin-type N-terminal cleavage/methylation domain-containing protein
MKRRKKMSNRGITLIELLVAMVISTVVIAGCYSLVISQGKAAAVQDKIVDCQQGVRSAMEIMVRDLQMTGFDDKQTDLIFPANPPVQCQNNSITVQYENNAALHIITYRLLNGALVRDELVNNVQTSETLLENVQSFTLTPTLSTDKVVGVIVNLSVTPDALNNSLSPRALTSNITFRNVIFSMGGTT